MPGMKINAETDEDVLEQASPEELEQQYDAEYPGDEDEEAAVEEIDGLGTYLYDLFDDAARDREQAERNWLRALEQYNGDDDYDDYDEPPNAESTDTTPVSGSRAFIRLTRTKIRSTDARMLDLLFPGGNEKNWSVEATVEPNVGVDIVENLIIQLAVDKLEAYAADINQLGHKQIQELADTGALVDVQAAVEMIQQKQIPAEFTPTDDEIEEAVKDDAKKRAGLMSEEIQDQLQEGRYRRECKKVIHSGNLYGTGWLKGPMVEYRRVTTWVQGDDGQWNVDAVEVPRPYFEFVPIWDVFPTDINVSEPADCEGLFQRYIMRRSDVRALGRRDDGFDKEKINSYLKDHPSGDGVPYRNFENDIRLSNKDDQGGVKPKHENRYEVLEYTGWANGELLLQHGVKDIEENSEYRSNVWILGGKVIKAALHSFDDDAVMTLHRYVFEEDETSIFGVGIGILMNHPQRMFNAAIRAVIDNMGSASGPIYEVNATLLHARELQNIDDMHALKVILRSGDGPEAQWDAIRIHQAESRISEFLAMAETAQQLGDEATALPKYTGGENVTGGAAGTATGLSMLMQQSNIVLKEPVANWDEGVTKPFIRGCYNWNMQFNDKEEIKGDMQVVAKGSTSLIMKEVRAQSIEDFAMNTKDPVDGPWIKRGNINRERATVRDLDADQFVYSEEEFAENVRKQQEAEMEMQIRNDAARAAPEEGVA